MIDLKEGEIICDKCKGTGSIKVKRDPTKSGPYHGVVMCLKCLGKGKFDWIENIIGVKVKTRFFNFDSLPKIDKEYLSKPLFFPITHKSK